MSAPRETKSVYRQIRTWGRVETLAKEGGIKPEDLLVEHFGPDLCAMSIKPLRALIAKIRTEKRA